MAEVEAGAKVVATGVSDDALKAAYRTINEADPNTAIQLTRLRGLYKEVGESEEVGERAIQEILNAGPGAAARLKGTCDAVARLWNIEEEV